MGTRADRNGGTDPGAFRWPPRRANGAGERSDPGGEMPHPPRAARRRTLLETIEEDWLGRAVPSFASRADATGWRPDNPAGYCERCGGSVGFGEAGIEGCAACRGDRLFWDGAVRLGEYGGLLREAILELKYAAHRETGEMLGRLLGEAVGRRLAGAQGSAVVVPVPTTRLRRLARNRGVDHSLTLARGVAAACGGRLVRALRRTHRPGQTGLSKQAREANLRGAVRLARDIDFGDMQYLVLVDDVRTTGATARSCLRALRAELVAAAGRGRGRVHVLLATAAVADERRRRAGESAGSAGFGMEKALDSSGVDA